MVSIKEVPSLLLAHQDYLRGAEYRSFAGQFIVEAQRDAIEAEGRSTRNVRVETVNELGRTFCNLQLEALENPSVLVPAAILEAAYDLAVSYPETLVWKSEMFLQTSGALVFEEGALFQDDKGNVVSIGMLIWDWRVSEEGAAVSLSTYTDTHDKRDSYVSMREDVARKAHLSKQSPDQPHVHLGRWHLAQFGAVLADQPVGVYVPADDTENGSEALHLHNLGRFVYGLLSLTNDAYTDSKGVPDRQYVDRNLIRRSKDKLPPVSPQVLSWG